MSAPRLRGALMFGVITLAAACGSSSDTGTNPQTGCETPLSPALGSVTSINGSTVCLSGGASGAEYELVAFDSGGPTTTITFTGMGLDTSDMVAPSTRLPDALAISASVSPSGAALDRGAFGSAFDARLRRSERRELTPRIPAARAAMLARSTSSGARFARFSVAPTVGTLDTLNAQANYGCSNPLPTVARVVSVSNKAIIVADTANPPGGFTTAQYDSIAATFDTLVDASDEGAFGAPTDIDGNGRVILFFTKEVNKLTPKGSRGVIGGFFYGRDLFPTSYPNDPSFACATSNYAEMFYLLVPDPNAVYSDARSARQVEQSTLATTGHEFQHLINASRRLYVNAAPEFEATFLDEGLAHVAEELLFYRATGLQPRQNIDLNVLRAGGQARIDAYNNFQINNLGRYETYLESPEQYGPYQPNDSLETRGAIWSALRYLADHNGPNDGTVWYNLVNTKLTGLANLKSVFGADVESKLRDWSVSVLTDDISANFPVQYQQPSWNNRTILAALNVSPFPLKMEPVTTAAPTTFTLKNPGSAYVKVHVKAGATGQLSWNSGGNALPAGIALTLVRTH